MGYSFQKIKMFSSIRTKYASSKFVLFSFGDNKCHVHAWPFSVGLKEHTIQYFEISKGMAMYNVLVVIRNMDPLLNTTPNGDIYVHKTKQTVVHLSLCNMSPLVFQFTKTLCLSTNGVCCILYSTHRSTRVCDITTLSYNCVQVHAYTKLKFADECVMQKINTTKRVTQEIYCAKFSSCPLIKCIRMTAV